MNELIELISDTALRDDWEFYAYKKYLCVDGKKERRIIDTPMSADDAWHAEVRLVNHVFSCLDTLF
jgi:hypothetical protein